MRCLYCDRKIEDFNFVRIYLQDDLLCSECRKKIVKDHRYININELKVETFYLYDGMFRNLLLQYKECYDEALAPVFLYLLEDYIRFKYFGYKIIFVPSSREKLQLRGFDHLKLMFSDVKLNKVEGISLRKQLVQEGKNKDERSIMIDNYLYEGPHLNKVLIVDDVLTTGSSIYGVFKALKPHCDSIKGLVLAHKENAFILNKKIIK